MTSSFEIKSKTGKTIRFEANYVCEMEEKIVDADGYMVNVGTEPSTAGSNLVVYVDGVKADTCWNPNFWCLIDLKDRPGCKKIWGLKIVFTDLEQAAEYDAWITSVIEAGKPEEVKQEEETKAENAKAEEIAAAKRIIKAAEAQEDIPTRDEAKRRMCIYNEINNEGGEGYVPHIYSQEEYEDALAFLAAQE